MYGESKAPSVDNHHSAMISCYFVLVDGLAELFRTNVCDHTNGFSYYTTIQAFLKSMSKATYWPIARLVWPKVIALGWEYLTSPLCLSLKDTMIDRMRAAVYRSLIRFFERPVMYIDLADDRQSDELLTALLHIQDYLEAENKMQVRAPSREDHRLELVVPPISSTQPSPRRVASQASLFIERQSMRASIDPSIRIHDSQRGDDTLSNVSGNVGQPKQKLTSIISVLNVLVQDQMARTRLWNTAQKAKTQHRGRNFSFPSSALIQQTFPLVLRVTSLLAIRFHQRFRWACNMDPTFPENHRSTPLLLCDHPDIIDYFVCLEGTSLPEEALLDAAPLTPSTAIKIFCTPTQRAKMSYLNLATRSLSSTPPDQLFFYIPQLVQALYYELPDKNPSATKKYPPSRCIEQVILKIAGISSLFSHQLIWNMKANMYSDDLGKQPSVLKPTLERITHSIVSQFSEPEMAFYQREFKFFDAVTSISASLKPYIKKDKAEKKKVIDQELAKIRVDAGVYLPSNPESTLVDIDYMSGRPLQSHAKVHVLLLMLYALFMHSFIH